MFHHCLVPIQAVLPSLDTVEDLRQLCSKVAACDSSISGGEIQTMLWLFALAWPCAGMGHGQQGCRGPAAPHVSSARWSRA